MPLAKKKRDNRHFMKRLTHDEVHSLPNAAYHQHKPHPRHDELHPLPWRHGVEHGIGSSERLHR